MCRGTSYLSPQQLQNTDEIIENLRPHIANISHRTYYRKRPGAKKQHLQDADALKMEWI